LKKLYVYNKLILPLILLILKEKKMHFIFGNLKQIKKILIKN